MVIGTSDGTVLLIDIGRNKVISTINMEGGKDCSVFSVDWNIEGFLAIASTD